MTRGADVGGWTFTLIVAAILALPVLAAVSCGALMVVGMLAQ